ncbi:MAG: hypothetical protein HOI66_07440 [Verrucomicrobia bacterium]|jgi:hypothetical protein|nr:hypothetical protein [Verrucomicrobiota bacterium]
MGNLGLTRRQFLSQSSLAAGALLVGREILGDEGKGFRMGTFRFDVTPPLGHSLCGGWIKPVEVIDDSLEAIGYVLLGAGDPIVVCVVDWTGLLNSAHLQWRKALAKAAKTSIDRVTVHCVHQHNAPFACLDTETIILEQGDLPHIVELEFFQQCLDSAQSAVRGALLRTTPITHISHGEAPVNQVAGNRRLIGLDGKVISQRGSSSRSAEHQRYPEGLIDPMLKTVAFYNGDRKIVSSHYYACHPMSYYGDGRVSADFCGLSRKQRQQQEPDCTHLYFNGCGGNIGAGKYNDGSKEMRPILVKRMLDGMVASESQLVPQPIETISWVSHDMLPPVNPSIDESALIQQISNRDLSVVDRNRPSYALAWIRRVRSEMPITLSAMHVNGVTLLHLPSECFVEYQLRAQATAPGRFVACAAYGDGGPWYIPTAPAYPEGGYAVSVAWCAPEVDGLLSQGILALLEA